MIEKRNKLKDRKSREQQQKVDDILKAAKKVFFKKGFLKTTMDEIAYEAALSKPTIYKFFPTKEDLYFSLVVPFIRESLHDMEEINLHLQLNMFSSGANLVKAVVDVFFKRYKAEPDIFRIGLLYQQAGMLWKIDKDIEDSIVGLSRDMMDEMRSLFDTAVNRGLIRNIDRYKLVDILFGSFFGVIQLEDSKSRRSSSTIDVESVINMTVELFLNAVVLK
ncbi:MAG TPA: TetR/AcrR family transcriptional regulator [Spirochaetota bacterium]|nr:TetR/AcrR family transcriptional regulator [Spirochaetota bacterium]HPS87376.1 TetR/AcrR family transcriptional regulator [Spirochaetota bacterium]